MSEKIPDGIERKHIISAIDDLKRGVRHAFADSTRYDVVHDNRRYPPKAVLGLAAKHLTGAELGPIDFKGGLGSKCFKILSENGFRVENKQDLSMLAGLPDWLSTEEVPDAYREGAGVQLWVNRFERNARIRDKALAYHGFRCSACDFDFGVIYGALGVGFMHVHHIKPLSTIRSQYIVNPIEDLRPVCPNCHAMIHRRDPPLSVEELRALVQSMRLDEARLIGPPETDSGCP